MNAKGIFKLLGFDYEYAGGINEHSGYKEEYRIIYTNDKMQLQFNLESKCLVITDLSNSIKYYNNPTIFLSNGILQAIALQMKELEWE